MTVGLPLALALLAQAAVNGQTYGPLPPPPPKPAVKAPEPLATTTEPCAAPRPGGNPNEIIVCVQRPQGYRLNPDIMEAKRAMRSGKPKPPERMRDTSCASVGPMGCLGSGAGIDLIGGAILLGTMVAKAVRGDNVGKMFITDPQPTEYQLYLEAKRAREAREAEEAAAAAAKAKAAPKP